MKIPNLYIFNPDHDLALANNDPNYMAPESARKMAAEMVLLPLWYADASDYVLAPSKYNLVFAEEMRKRFPHLPRLITEQELSNQSFNIVPWGWNASLKNRLLKLGVSERLLPPKETLDLIRTYSNRKFASALLPKLLVDTSCCGESHYLTTIEELREFVMQHPDAVLKMPLSGSGKGLCWCKGNFDKPIANWCINVLKQQGGVVAEPMYKKVRDCSMLFYCDKNSVRFYGYSLFVTSGKGVYTGNIQMPDELIEKELNTYVAQETLRVVRMAIEKELSLTLPSFYNGFLGVDMMVCSASDNNSIYNLHPCVEINLRTTMGVVAHEICDRYLHPASIGTFQIDIVKSGVNVAFNPQEDVEKLPLVYTQEKIKEGSFPLVPVTADSQYVATVVVRSQFPQIH